MTNKEFRPGRSALTGDGMAPGPTSAVGKRTLTEALPSTAPKAETKGGGTAKLDAGLGDAKGVEAAPMDAGGAKAAAAARVVPKFVLSEKEGARSNTKAATTDTDNPTFTGKIVKDGGGWRYQLASVESKGTIDLVYYTADHYPAPTPNDDSGDLSNVTKDNWKDIVKDLKDHRTIVAGNWSSYRRTYLHEHYHWETEWQGEVKKALIKAEDEIAKLSSAAATEADAKAELEPKATKIFNDHMRAARTAYNALPDTPGSAPYVAGAAGVDALVKRVEAHASSQKW
ncbi:MAG TPA: hypothetical protein VNO30_00765 [Kofleriaceae bacterium]|nr:hypothetical protein [Kofleriaceae bacterium]